MTHLDLLNTFPSPYREQAIEAIKKQHGENAESIFNSDKFEKLWSLLQHTEIIDWSNSPQGYTYWANVSDKLINGEFDNPSVRLTPEDWQVVCKCIIAIIEEPENWKGVKQEERILKSIQSQLKP
jgi:hypothetical protein